MLNAFLSMIIIFFVIGFVGLFSYKIFLEIKQTVSEIRRMKSERAEGEGRGLDA